MTSEWFHPAGSLARGGWETVVDDTLPGWRHTGLRVGVLEAGGTLELPAGEVERLLVPLAGSFEVDVFDQGCERPTPDVVGSPAPAAIALTGRANPFDTATDTLYLPVGHRGTIRGTGRIAVAEAPACVRHPLRRITAEETPIELRGGGRSSRLVRNFGVPGVLDADRFIVCEVVTPDGNWSSYPAHKHDEHVPGRESRLEEIYLFEVRPVTGAPASADAFGWFSASSSAGEISLDERVRDGDIALIPFGYHGPAAAPPGTDMYYLNVMAGPDPDREWLISDDPGQAWVRDAWPAEGMDARLTKGSA